MSLYALEFLAGQQWAVMPSVLEAMSSIAQRESTGVDLEALLKREGLPVSGTRTVTNRDGVAVIPVVGVISRWANMFTDVCGSGATIQRLATDINTALDDPSIRALVLEIDSPGGQVTGVNELADQIYASRGRKPIVAYGGGNVASGAYWLASACDEVVIDATAQVGSIGVVGTYRIVKDNDRVQTVELVASRSPNKRPDITTEQGKAKALASIDAMADVFIDRVARNLGIDDDAVVAGGDEGGVLVGQHAVDAGLAHRLGSLEGLIAELSGSSRTTTIGRVAAKPSTAAAAATHRKQEDNPMVLTIEQGASASAVADALKAQHPEAFAAIAKQGREEASTGHAQAIEAARKEAAEAETARVKAVFEQSMPGHEALIQSLALDGETTGEQAAVRVLAAERQASTDHLETVRNTPANQVKDVATKGDEGKGKVNSKDVASQAEALVQEARSNGKTLSISAAVRQITGGNHA